MRINRVVTRQGDGGTTQLVGGAVVSKDDIRVEAYGSVDELNAQVGLARALIGRADAVAIELDDALGAIQQDLFDVGADLATPAADRHPSMRQVSDEDVLRLETVVDRWNANLPPLRDFVLPGGSPPLAALHVARTVCRRAERRTVTLIRAVPDVDSAAIRYLNRLSDLLFVAGRWFANARGEVEPIWIRDRFKTLSPP